MVFLILTDVKVACRVALGVLVRTLARIAAEALPDAFVVEEANTAITAEAQQPPTAVGTAAATVKLRLHADRWVLAVPLRSWAKQSACCSSRLCTSMFLAPAGWHVPNPNPNPNSTPSLTLTLTLTPTLT